MIVLVAIFSASLVGLIGVLVMVLRARAARRATDPYPHDSSSNEARKGFGKGASARSGTPEARQMAGNASPPAGRRRIIQAADYAGEESLSVQSAQAGLAAIEQFGAAPALASGASGLLHDAAGQAIVFRQAFPPAALPENGRSSWFGGLPGADHGFVWPRGARSGRPLHFIMQVDLAEIPAPARLGLLPDHGLLGLFIDLADGLGDEAAVVWQANGASEAMAPADLPPAYGTQGAGVWPWTLPGEPGTAVLPCWPIEPVAITVPQPDGALIWPGNEAVAPALLAAQGEPVAFDPIGPRDFPALTPPWSGFPRDWLSVQIVAAQLVQEAERAARVPSPSLWPELSEEQRLAEITRIRDEALAWHDHALRNAAFEPLDGDVRSVFNQWFAAQDELARLVAPRAFEAAIETGLHANPDGASAVPGAILDRIAGRHALATFAEGQILAELPERMLSGPSGLPDAAPGGCAPDLAQTHLLLFELGDNPGLSHHFGGLIVQVWITPDDLAARRFDAAVFTKLPAWTAPGTASPLN